MEDVSKNELSPQESLRLIQTMIETTKNAIGDRSHYFLLWGWGVFSACILQFVLKVFINSPYNGAAWLIMPFIFAAHIFFIVQDKKREKIKTFISDANNYLWTALVFAFLVAGFIFSKLGWENCFPVYTILYGIGTYVSGCLIKFKPLLYGGIACFPLALLCAHVGFDARILVMSFALLISYIVPGHLLRLQYLRQNK